MTPDLAETRLGDINGGQAAEGPNKAVLTNLLMSLNPEASFAPSTLHPNKADALSRLSRIQKPMPARLVHPAMQLGTPAEVYHALAAKGEANTKMSVAKTFWLQWMGGFQCGVAGMLCIAVCGNIPGIPPGLVKLLFGTLFASALMLILGTGTQVFTGNAASMPAALFEGKCTMGDLLKNWAIAYPGNLLGGVFFAYMVAYAGLLTGPTGNFIAGLGAAKCAGGTFGQMVVKGIMCNYLVNMGIFFAGQAKDMIGRYIGIWVPVSCFVASGYEHSIANMFLLPAAMLAEGSTLDLRTVIVKNMIPVTIGNTIAGVVLVSGYFSYMFGKLGQSKH